MYWRVSENGEFTARVRGCRHTPTARIGSYCGPYSNAVTVVTFVPVTPVELKRIVPLIPLTGSSTDVIGVRWTPGPRTPTSVWYEVANGPYGGLPCPPALAAPGAICGYGMVNPTISSTTATTFVRESHAPSKHVFQVRACSTAGCSPYTPPLIIEHIDILGPAGPDLPNIAPMDPPPSRDRPLDLDRPRPIPPPSRNQR